MAQRIDITLPESEQEGTMSVIERWLKKQGDHVTAYEPIVEINTDKVSLEIAAPATGILVEIIKRENEEVNPGDILGRIELMDEESSSLETQKNHEKLLEKTTPLFPQQMRLSPAVRRLIKEHHIDISLIKGSGRGGRITFQDVKNYLETKEGKAQKPAAGTPIDMGLGPGKMIPHSQMRRSIATHMVESMLKTAPHVMAVFEADLSAMVAHRDKHKPDFQQKGVRLTYTAYFVEAAVKALQAVPEVNSRWHDDALEIFTDYNIGVATALDEGLIVPVIHRAQQLDLFGIASRLQELIDKARTGRLSPHEVQNGTFTITNHGVSGSLIATPIINQPQSAILGIGKIEYRMMVVEENNRLLPQIKPMAYVTLTIDHRALDGFKANTFLNYFVEALQRWS